MPESMFATLFPALLPALVILAFRTLCTLRPAPVPEYLKAPIARGYVAQGHGHGG